MNHCGVDVPLVWKGGRWTRCVCRSPGICCFHCSRGRGTATAGGAAADGAEAALDAHAAVSCDGVLSGNEC